MKSHEIREMAEQKRGEAKRLFGESLGRSGWLNGDLPMARFVDAVVDAAILEVAAVQMQALEDSK